MEIDFAKEFDSSNDTYIGETLMRGISKAETPFIVDGVVIGYPFNLRQTINQFGKEIIPNCLGIYHLFYNDRLVYIGMSKNIRGRLLYHLKDNNMPFNNVLWFCASHYKENCTIENILQIECNMIKRFTPSLNTVHASCR